MKVFAGSHSSSIWRGALAMLWLRKKRSTPRDRYEAAIAASRVTPEQRRAALTHAAADPRIEGALDDADLSHEEYLKGPAQGELRSRSITPRPSGD